MRREFGVLRERSVLRFSFDTFSQIGTIDCILFSMLIFECLLLWLGDSNMRFFRLGPSKFVEDFTRNNKVILGWDEKDTAAAWARSNVDASASGDHARALLQALMVANGALISASLATVASTKEGWPALPLAISAIGVFLAGLALLSLHEAAVDWIDFWEVRARSDNKSNSELRTLYFEMAIYYGRRYRQFVLGSLFAFVAGALLLGVVLVAEPKDGSPSKPLKAQCPSNYSTPISLR